LSIMRDAEVGPGHKNLRLAIFVLAAAMPWLAAGAQAQSWSVYGGEAGGTRYSAATEITKANVTKLRIAWTYHTVTQHGMVHPSPAVPWK
jgi:glucose dehydrogenase